MWRRTSCDALPKVRVSVDQRIQEVAYYNIFLTEAILKLLAERGILTGEEVLERVKKLKNETPLQLRWMQ